MTRATRPRKKKTITAARKKAWAAVSRYVRYKASDQYGMAECVTCGVRQSWKIMHAGHFIPQAQGNAVKFDERNIHCQCLRCNVHLGSNGPMYYKFMRDWYGQETIDELIRLSNTTVKYYVSDLEEIEQEFKSRLNDLVEHRGVAA